MNKNGKTALHLCVELKLTEGVRYLLWKGANQHIIDFTEQDCCDKAKENGLAIDFKEFNNCNVRKKYHPKVPESVKMKLKYSSCYTKIAE